MLFVLVVVTLFDEGDPFIFTVDLSPWEFLVLLSRIPIL